MHAAGHVPRRRVHRLLDVPQPVVVFERISQRRLHARSIPVGLPGKGDLVHQAFDHDHLALELAGHHAALVEELGDVDRSLRMQRRTVRVAVLIVDVVVG
ncbi:MAG TPA: hypothetical protein VJV78_33885 [Polyangiales bacterium]|nr:hypothetical protein [Polyangiales bacterium]